MNALRQLVTRLYNEIVPLVPPPELPDLSNMTPEQIAAYHAKVAAYFDRKEREQAAVRRDLKAEDNNMRRGR